MKIFYELKQFFKPFPAMGSWSYRFQLWMYDLPRKIRNRRRRITIIIHVEGLNGDVVSEDTIFKIIRHVGIDWQHDPSGVVDEISPRNAEPFNWP